jgi:hypothetical protein
VVSLLGEWRTLRQRSARRQSVAKPNTHFSAGALTPAAAGRMVQVTEDQGGETGRSVASSAASRASAAELTNRSEAHMTRRILPLAVLSLVFAGSAGWAAAQDARAETPRAGVVPDLRTAQPESLGFNDLRRIIRGFQIAPVPLNLHGLNLAQVGLGSYIVNAQGGCNDCHTNPPFAEGGDPFQGQPKRINAEAYLAGGTMFGPFVSRNLTPDENGRPAGLTFAQFREVIRTGKDIDHVPPHVPSEENDLLQVMPWPIYREMIDDDLRAIYEFLRSIPHVESGASR